MHALLPTITQMSRTHRRLVGVLALVCLVLGSVALFFFLTRETRAAIGDIAIYREVTGTDDAIGTTAANITWDTTVREAGLYSIDVGRTDVTLSEQGHYLVMYNIGAETSGGSGRSEVQGYLNLAGTDQAYGRGSCYIRRANGQNECFLSGAAIIETSGTNQALRVVGQRTDSNSATVRRMAGKSGYMLLRLDDAWDYLRVREAGGGQAFNSATFATVDWDNNDELDTGTFSRSGGDITLARAGHYLVTANVMFRNSGTGQRNQAIRITLDGYEIPGTRTTAYSGGTSSTLDHSAVWMGIIVATTTNQVLRLQGACSGETCSRMTNVGGQTAMTIARLPETAEYLRLTELGGGQAVDGTDDPILWDTQSEVDTAFSHSTTSNTSRVTFNTDDDYLFFGSFFSDRTGTAATTEQYPHWEWRTNVGGKATYGSFGSYNRGDSGTTGAFTSGSAGGVILAASSTNYVELVNTDESTVNDALNVFVAERTSLMGVRVSTLNMADVYVQTRGTQVATSSVPSTNLYLDGAFTIEATRGAETVTDITIAENGTVDADADLANIRLYYETDTSAPYDCASESYNKTEAQFGATSTNGFSGANGTSSFSGSVAISKTATMCVYVVLDVLDSATDGETIEVEITDASEDVVIASGDTSPNIAQAISGATTLLDDNLTQIHYHFRNDNGGEATSTSATAGVEDTPLVGLVKNSPMRLRFEVSNEGSYEAPPVQLRFEYATKTASCSAASDWRDVGSAGEGFSMYNSSYFEHGSSTTNIATTTGGVTDENDVFLSPNGGMLDTSSESGSLTLASTTFVELEYAFQANNGTESGTTYCFRLSDQGTELKTYALYPEATIKADVLVSATSSQAVSVNASSTAAYLGGAFVITDQSSSSRQVTNITITETGTADAQQELDNVLLRYDLDTSVPYDCGSESYDPSDLQFGLTDTDGFSGPNGSSTFAGSVTASTTATMCVYVVFDVKPTAMNGATVEVSLANASEDVVVSSGTINPNTSVALDGTTTIVASELDQLHFQFRFDDGSETLASSMTGGVEDTPITVLRRGDAHRLRMLVSNEGGTSTPVTVFRLEYGTKVSTCAAIASWSSIASDDGAWALSPTTNLTDGADTTNIATTTGGVTDENSVFLSPNGGVRDESGETGSLVLTETEFVELEFSIEATENASAGTTYCFRLTNAGATLSGDYTVYPEATVANTNDFFIQRGISTIVTNASSTTITAGVDYTKPVRSGTAFIRITNSQHTGAGHSVGGASQVANAVTVYVSNPDNIANSITFERGSTNASLNTRVNWEIIEYRGSVGGDNEIVVRSASTATFADASATVNASVANVATDADMVVFVTGIYNPNADVTSYHQSTVEANWNGGTDEAVFTRRATGNATRVSFAAVEFTGANWKVQRISHTYSAAGSEQQVPIPEPLNSTARAFLVTQYSSAQNGLDELGGEAWISSVSTVSFQLEATASPANGKTHVVWVIENTQTNGTPMKVTRSNGTHTGSVEASIETRSIGITLADLTASSIFLNNRSSGTGTQYPRNIIAYRLISTTEYELYVSEISASTRTYRTEVVEWPTAVRTVTQNYYRFYVDNDALDPEDAWPPGGGDLGEITSITGMNTPPEPGDKVRIRVSLKVAGNSMSARTRAFKLQFGERETTCGAISTWFDVGDSASTTALWRAWNGSTADGTEVGELKLSQSDRAGTYEEDGPTSLNPNKVFIGEDVEYDWSLLDQGAPDLTTYCFRMVDSSGAPLDDYLYYPTLTTAGYVVEVSAWRFFGDSENTTPTTPLAATNTAPTAVDVLDPFKLRVVLSETAGKSGANVKYKLQYSEFPDFSVAYDVASQDQCTSGSRFCYADGAGSEGAILANRTISTADSCAGGVGDGCGTVNEYPFVPGEIGEVGTTTANSAGTVVSLGRTYQNPVIIVESISGDDGGGSGNRPAAAIITATTSSSFTVRIQEPDDEPDTHGVETVAYLVLEAGAHMLPDGTRIDAGLLSTSAYYGNAVAGTSESTCTFAQTFTSAPVVLSALQTNNNTGSPDFLTVYQRSVTPSNFTCAIEVPDGENNSPTTPEVIGWVALSKGTFTNNDTLFEVATTSVSVTGWTDTPWFSYVFPTLYYGSAPGIIASKQTRNGGDGGWVRYDSVDASSTRLAIDERDSGNRTHTAESVGLLSFSRGTMLIAATTSDFTFDAVTNKEFEFTFENHDAGVNRAYYFRLYDVERSLAIATTSQPSLVTAGGSLSFALVGLPSGTATEGVVTDVTTTPTSIAFGTLPWNTDMEAAHRLTVSTNAARGYQVFLFERQGLTAGAREIEKVTGTNENPLVWSVGCDAGASGCWGYHAGDDTLAGGSTRFLSDNAYAAPTSTLSEVAYSSVPVPLSESTDVVYRIKVTPNQVAGNYESKLVYVIVPVF